MTKMRGDGEVHKDTEEKPGWCTDPHLPHCAAFVEIMATVFSREAWRCVWYMIQFHSQMQNRRRPSDSRIPFEYCYDMSPDANTSLIPSMSLTMGGGSHFAVYDPIIIISTQSELVYCLAVVKSAELSIIGQNFMTGYRVVFDREKLTLGWKKFD